MEKMTGTRSEAKFKRTTPHVCQRCGICCKGRGDLWGDEDRWPNGTEPDDCTCLDFKDGKAVCAVYDDRRYFCEDYPWDEWCERELREKGLWGEFLK
jgi:Fe-S-cluster containining protein